VADQLQYVIGVTDSPLGFLTVGSIASMPEKVTIWAALRPSLEFMVGLIDSHRQGTGKMTRISVYNNAGAYTIKVEDDPGVDLPNLRLGYGELVSGYQVVPFGPEWVSIIHAIGRTKEGIKVEYTSETAPTITTAEWGRFGASEMWSDLYDLHDLKRRAKQRAWERGRIGQKVGLGLKANALRPLDGYAILDRVPVEIIHGEIDTRDYADYWTIIGMTWETSTDGSSDLTLSITPRVSLVGADDDLVTSSPFTNPDVLVGPDGINARAGSKHVHAYGEVIIGNGTTLAFITAQEFEPDSVTADNNGVRVDVVEGATYDSVLFATAPTIEGDVRLSYLARLV
jgi:hypothetical protein